MNGHLLRWRCACFAKRAERSIDSAKERRSALSGAHVLTTYAPVRFSRRLATYLQEKQYWKSPKGASGAFLTRLDLHRA
jgi:hypothetical protein